MKNIALLTVALSLVIMANASAQVAEQNQTAPVVEEQNQTAPVVEEQNTEVAVEAKNADSESEPQEPQNEVFLTPEAKAKQEIADNNYSLSFFTQRMDLSLDQLDQAKKFSEEDRLKRESLLKSIYMLRDQSRELEQQSLEKFKGLLNAEQLAVFEELRKEQKNYRDKYDVLAGNVQQQVEREKKIIEFDNKQMEEDKKKAEEQQKFEEEIRKQEAEGIKHGRWDLFN